jgi:hypothetical protein
VAALAADPKVAAKTGRVLNSWSLAEEYGFTDMDGRRPHWDRYMKEIEHPYVKGAKKFDDGFYEYWSGLADEA